MIEIISFGYLHGPAPQAHATFDVRHHFKDPHVDPALRHLTAADAPVMRAVLGTPGIGELAAAITAAALAYLAGPQPGPAVIAIGCAGGRHRSAALAIEAARQLRDAGIPVTLTHRDIDNVMTCSKKLRQNRDYTVVALIAFACIHPSNGQQHAFFLQAPSSAQC